MKLASELAVKFVRRADPVAEDMGGERELRSHWSLSLNKGREKQSWGMVLFR